MASVEAESVAIVAVEDPPNPALALVPLDKVTEQHPVEAGMVNCCFGCGFSCLVGSKELSNIGNQRSPRYTCRPCDNARCALERQLRKDDSWKKWMTDVKRQDPGQWNAIVRKFRLSPGETPSSASTDSGNRLHKIATFMTSVQQFISVKEKVGVFWCNRRQYIAHHKFIQGLDESEAVAKWEADKVNPNILKQGEGEDLEIPVQALKETVGERGKVSK